MTSKEEIEYHKIKGLISATLATHIGEPNAVGMGELHEAVFGSPWENRVRHPQAAEIHYPPAPGRRPDLLGDLVGRRRVLPACRQQRTGQLSAPVESPGAENPLAGGEDSESLPAGTVGPDAPGNGG